MKPSASGWLQGQDPGAAISPGEGEALICMGHGWQGYGVTG